MKHIFLVLVVFTAHMFAVDATIEVIKKVEDLPTIELQGANVEQSLALIDKKFAPLLLSDINVLAHFRVNNEVKKIGYDSIFNTTRNDYTLRYRLRSDNTGRLNCDFKLLNVTGERVFEKSYHLKNNAHYVFLAHAVASDINDFLGMASVEWMKKYVILARYKGAKKSEIVVADYTLTYQQTVVKGGLDIFPKWASASQSAFYYTHYTDRGPEIYKFDMATGRKSKILESDGMAICSDVSADGRKMLLTLAPNGQPDVYMYDVVNRTKERITSYTGIDVNANFIDGDKRITFVSDRLGYPNVFAKTLGKRGVEQLVYYGKSNNSCSAYKNYIVYTSRESGHEFEYNTFNLHLISTKSDFIRRLTSSGVNQFPKFSFDGESVIFIKTYRNESSVGVIRLKYNRSFLFPLKGGKIQSLDW